LKWSPKHKAFYSEGKLGLLNIGRNDINGAFEGFMEVKKTEDGGPVFNVFIKASPEAWYYFGLEDNRLLVHTSNSEFNSIISKKTTGGKAKIGEVAFIPGSDDETLSFINRFRRDYYQIDVPYDLTDYAAPAQTPDIHREEIQTIPEPAQQAPVEKRRNKRDTEPAQQDTAPQDTIPQDTTPQDTAPQDTAPQEDPGVKTTPQETKDDGRKQERRKREQPQRKKKTDTEELPPVEQQQQKEEEIPEADDEGF
jgi:hypothetical protein